MAFAGVAPMVTIGVVVTVTNLFVVAVVPQASVIVTLYVVVALGDLVIAAVVSPLLQTNVRGETAPVALAVSVVD